jgi:hypothetical protein
MLGRHSRAVRSEPLVLQSILPGLRQLRAPLAAGYIWLLTLWLLLHDTLTSPDGSWLRDRFVELATWAGKPVVLAASAAAAYLVGTLSIALSKGLSRAIRPLVRPRLAWLIPRYWTDKQIESVLDDAVDKRLSEHYVDNQQFRSILVDYVTSCRSRATADRQTLEPMLNYLPPTSTLEQDTLDDEFLRLHLITTLINTSEYVGAAKDDIGHLAYRLLGKEDRVYDEYDRLRAEGIFRLGLALPLGFLSAALAYLDNPWWLAGVVVPIVFAYLGGAAFAEAERGLAAAVSSGRVELPSLERIRTRDVKLVPYRDLIE